MGFEQGLSGLNSSSQALDVVGNNVSNSGTVGFKSARAEFADVFAASLSGAGGAAQVGIGSRVSNVAQQFSQGNITSTSNALDVAINGNGFFVMSDQSGALSYTRNGQFQLDKNGYLVNADGLNVEGYPANYSTNSLGVINSTTPSNIYIDPTDLQPQVTGTGAINVNLDARSSIPPSGHESFNPSDPLSYTSSTSMSVYDSLGNVHTLSMYFIYAGTTNTGTPNQQSNWQVRYALDGVANSTAAYQGGDPWTTPALSAQPGTVVGSTYTAGAADGGGTINISVDGGAAQNLTIPALVAPATYDAQTLAAAINAAGLTGATASAASPTGPVIITSSTTGTTSSVTVAAGTPLAGPPAVPALTVADIFGTGNPTTVAGSNPTVPFPTGDNVTLSFDTSGKLVDYNHQGSLTPAPTLTIDLASVVGVQNKAATPMTINTLDYSSTTQFGTAFGVNSLTQDGYPSGRLTKISISQDGVIQGNYTNGQTRNMAQLVLARFTNPNGLQNIGGNQWQETFSSGVPLVGAPGSASNGLLQDSALEESTVDLTQELVNMITYQRAYQANAQTIKTQDQILQTLVNLQ